MLSDEKANSFLMRLSAAAYLRIFIASAVLIGILTMIHSIFLVYLYYHFQSLQGNKLYVLSWILFALSGLQQVITILIYFWSIKRILSDAKDHKLEINASKMWCNLSVGLITIASYTIDMGGKCLVFFVDTNRDNE